MRLLIDVNMPGGLAPVLRGEGHDVLELRELRLQWMPDPQIVARAIAEQRVIVTFDLDFPKLLAHSRGQFPSLVVFRLQAKFEQVVSLLLRVLEAHAADLAEGAIVVVEPDGMRVRRLPVR